VNAPIQHETGPVARSGRAEAARRKPVPVLYWPLWLGTLGLALVVFYGILTPVWMGVRLVAWASERPPFRRRRR
jgi:hypothetical protein